MVTPLWKRSMIFIDGSNLLIELSKEIDRFRADRPPTSVFRLADLLIKDIPNPAEVNIRRYWFASYQGSSEDSYHLREWLRERHFEPVLFKKHEGREKGVDIALTKEMLVNAFNRNFDVAHLVAGDADYIGLVSEVKRYGAQVKGAFFSHGLSPDLKLVFDSFHELKIDIQRHKDAIEALKDELKEIENRGPI